MSKAKIQLFKINMTHRFYYPLFLAILLLICCKLSLGQTTLVLQPGAEDGKDAHLSNLSPNVNGGDRDENTAMAWTNQGVPFILRALIEFDLSSIPQGANILSAYLSLYNNPDASANNGQHSSLSGPNTSLISRITEEWYEHTVTWNNQPAITTLHQVTLPQSVSPHQDYENIDVTQLVKDMIENPETGHGFMLHLVTEQLYRCMTFASSDYYNASKHPKLVITYLYHDVIADFRYDSNTLDVDFTNLSVNATNYQWDLGDGTISFDENPVHLYDDYGDYDVTLIASNQFDSDAVTKTIHLCKKPTADFNYLVTGMTVHFTNQSGDASSYSWDFGDGMISTSQNPVHIYQNNGVYSVKLIAFSTCGTDTASVILTLCTLPTAGFYFANNDLSVSFFNNSIHCDYCSWDFGDGAGSTLTNPIYHYNGYGEYNVMLIVYNSCGTDTSITTINICRGPQAYFDFQIVDLTVYLTGHSNDSSSYLWDFGDGITSALTSPVHTYQVNGEYNITLVVSNACGSDTVSALLGICPLPVAGFQYINDSLTVTFNNASLNSDWFLWEFGDGSGSTIKDPVHHYELSDFYQVVLVAGNGCGTDTTRVNLHVKPSGYIQDIVIYPNPVGEKLTIKIMNFKGEDLLFELYNSLGQIITDFFIHVVEKLTLEYLDMSHLQPGCYDLKIIGRDYMTTKKVIHK